MNAPKNMVPLHSWVAHGFRCAVVRAPIYGAINGYVQIPGITHEQAEQVDAHGGVTFGPSDDNWIGFDTLHSGDWWPGMQEYYQSRGENDRTWTQDQVIEATEEMALSAKQVIEQ